MQRRQTEHARLGQHALRAGAGGPTPYRTFGVFGELPFWPGGLTLVAAAPGVGKTSWMLRMVAEAAASDVPSAIGCYEHTPDELAFRIRRQGEAVVAGAHDAVAEDVVGRQVADWSDALLLELDDRQDTVRMLEDMLISHYAFPRRGPALVAVDYLQRVPVVGVGGLVSDDTRAGEAAAALRGISRRRGWAIVAASATKADTFAADDVGLEAILGDERVVYEADRVLWATPEVTRSCGCARWHVKMLKDRTGPATDFHMTFWGERFYPQRGDVLHTGG